MQFFIKFILGAFFAIALSLPASADTRVVPANRTTPIAFFYVYNQDCYSGSKPEFIVLQPGAHGRVTSKWLSLKIAEKKVNRCNGKKMLGTAIFYTPAKGFRGKDVVKFSLRGSNGFANTGPGVSRSFSFEITVR